MARRKKEDVPPETIDYLKLIDEYDAAAFSLCVTHLFPLFNYYLLKENDVRPIDLKDQIVQMEHEFYGSDTTEGLNLTYLCSSALLAYLESMVNIESGSRAAKYQVHGISLLNSILDNKQVSLKDLEDALLITISILRPNKGRIGEDVAPKVNHIDIELKKDDFEVLQELWEIMMAAYDPSRPGILKRRANDIETQNMFTMAHVIFVVLFCRMLQQRGVFVSEDA